MTIRQTIISDAMLTALIANMKELPERILTAKDCLAKVEYELAVFNAVEIANDDIKTLEGAALFEATNEEVTIPNGNDKETSKPIMKKVKKYTNESQRAAAVTAILSASQDYIDAKNRLIAAERAKAEMNFQLAKNRNNLGYLIDQSYTNKSLADIAAGLSREDDAAGRLELIARKEAVLNTVMKSLSELESTHA